MAKKKRRRRSRSRSGGPVLSGKKKAYLVAGAAAYGYVKEHTTFVASVPKVDAIGTDFTIGLGLHFLNKHMFRSKMLDYVAVAALSVGGYKLGVNKLDVKKLEGDDHHDDDVVMGTVDVDA